MSKEPCPLQAESRSAQAINQKHQCSLSLTGDHSPVSDSECKSTRRVEIRPSIKRRSVLPATTPQFQMHKMIELHILLFALAFLQSRVEGQALTGTEMSTINCEGEDCATLYLITSSGEEVAHKGTNSKIKQKDVEAAKVVGMGCFMIYKGKGFSGPSIKIEGASPLSLKDEGHTWTTVK